MKNLVVHFRFWRPDCVLCLVVAAVAGLAPADAAHAQISADRPGISVLVPAQSFPIAPDTAAGAVAERALDPIDDDPLANREDDIPTVAPGGLLYRQGVDSAPVADRRGGDSTGTGVRYGVAPTTPHRLGPAPESPGWLAGVGNFTHHEGDLATVTIGQVVDRGSFWGNAPRLGGVQLARLPTASDRGTLLPGTFGMTTALGFTALQDMSEPTPSSRLAFSSPAGSGSFLYGLTPDLTIESRLRAGPEQASAGFGGTYAFADWGTLRVNASQVQEPDAQALNSGLGMQVRWEDHALESTYQSLRTGGITTGQRVGVTHHWAVSPQLGLRMGADRDLASGSYALHLQMSVPIDAVGILWPR